MSAARGRSRSIALATCCALPDGDEDAALLAAALTRAVDAVALVRLGRPGRRLGRLRPDRHPLDLGLHRRPRRLPALGRPRTPRLHNPHPSSNGTATRPTFATSRTPACRPCRRTGSTPGRDVRTARRRIRAQADRRRRLEGRRPVRPDAAGALASGRGAPRRAARRRSNGDGAALSGRRRHRRRGGAGLLRRPFSHAITKRAMLAPATVNALDPGYSRSLFVPERITAAHALGGRTRPRRPGHRPTSPSGSGRCSTPGSICCRHPTARSSSRSS